MTLPPDDATPVPSTLAPLPSPRAAAERAMVYRRRVPERGHSRWLRIIALALSLLVHVALLVGVLFGPAYVPQPPRPETAPLLVRLIDSAPEPPPPPPLRGTPPKQRGPLKRNTAGAAAQAAPRPVAIARKRSSPSSRLASRPSAAKITEAPAPAPQPAPPPTLQPVPLSPPSITLDTPPVARALPPRFQPEPMRKPTPEGNQPVLPPPSLAEPVQPPSPPRISVPSVAVDRPVLDMAITPGAPVARPQLAAARPAPELPPVPSITPPTVPMPALDVPLLQTPATAVTDQRPERQPVEVLQPELQPEPQLPAVPIAPIAPSALDALPETTLPENSLPNVAPASASIAVSIARPQLAEPTPSGETATPSINERKVTAASNSEDVAASAPNASEQGSDTATPGSPEGAPKPSSIAAGRGRVPTPRPGQGNNPGDTGNAGGIQDAVQAGEKGAPGSFIQVKPHGDTDIMEHRAANIGYKRTRFEQDWAPQNETILDTALRHAVEETTVEHTFHLPRGVRIKCVVMPLFPMVMLGCGNPDPPAKPLDDEIYKRLNLATANPLVSSLPASAATAAPAPPVQLDNAVPCANARVAGGPLPPGCGPINPSLEPTAAPAPSSSSWAPPSDQFQ